jgi:hypothetical protein
MGGNDQNHVQQTEIDDDTDLFELIIFNLSPVLGDRDQVLATPFIECLKYLELHQRRTEQDRWNGFMDKFYSNMQNFSKENAHTVQEYIKAIQPELARKDLSKNKTDLGQLARMKMEQEERAKQSEQGG